MGEIQGDAEKCPNHGFEDIAQSSIFHIGLRFDTKIFLGIVVGGTMMAIDAEKATKIIDALISTDYQAQNDRQLESKKRMMDHNTSNAYLAQNKILTQQIEALTKQISSLPQHYKLCIVIIKFNQ